MKKKRIRRPYPKARATKRSKAEKENQESKLLKRYNQLLWVVALVTALAGFITNFGVIASFFKKNIKPLWKTSSLIIFEDTSKYNILLLPFGPDGTCELEKNFYHHQVHRRLVQLIEEKGLSIEVERQDTIMCDIINAELVLDYGQLRGADLIIYGNYQERCEWDTTLINISYVTTIGTNTISNGETGYQGESKNYVLTNLREGAYTGEVENIIFFSLSTAEMNNQNWKNAIDLIDKATGTMKDSISRLGENLIKGISFFKIEEYDSAIKYLNLIDKEVDLKSNQELNDFTLMLGVANSMKGNHRKAVQHFISYEGHARDFAYVQLTNSLANLKEYKLAINYCTKAIELKDHEAYPEWFLYEMRAHLYELVDSVDFSINDINFAIHLNPECETCKDYRAQLVNK